MVQIRTTPSSRVNQGDVYRDIDFLEYAVEREGIIEVSMVSFPLVVVLSQDCDLEQDNRFRSDASKNQDKWLLSVLVAPLYNVEHLLTGEHLTELGYAMQLISRKSTYFDLIKNNQIPRYHFLDFAPDTQVVPSVVDFKHYFSVNVKYLQSLHPTNHLFMISPLFREEISRRFAAFLARIGLPESYEADL
jgi:hypothetical protein